MLAAGVSRHRIQRRIDSGSLIRVHPGVYLVGHRGGSPLASEAAAILACGPRAFLSHRTAASLWELPVPRSGPIEVTVVGRRQRSPGGVRARYLTAMPASERRRLRRLPLTSPSLTILDLAGTVRPEALAAALNEARVLRIVNERALTTTLSAHPNRRGARALRRLLEGEQGPRITRSEAELRALRLMRAHGLEPEESDVSIGPWRVDFLFRQELLIVEVDGYRYHSTPRRFIQDRRRLADLAARGLQVFPLSWSDITSDGQRAMRRLQMTLERRRAQLAGTAGPGDFSRRRRQQRPEYENPRRR